MLFFTSATKIVSVAFLLNLLSMLAVLTPIWQPLLAVSAAASLLWGCLGAFYEVSLKRFIAYTSINQMGFVLVGLACAELDAYRNTILYLILYMYTVIPFIYLLTQLEWSSGFNQKTNVSNRTVVYMSDLQGLAGPYSQSTEFKGALVIALALFSMAGIPPLAGFFGKYFLLFTAYEAGQITLVIIGLATSLLSAYYYLRLVNMM